MSGRAELSAISGQLFSLANGVASCGMRDVDIRFTSITWASNQRAATRGIKMLLEKQDFTVV
jgi:hypothetical protein